MWQGRASRRSTRWARYRKRGRRGRGRDGAGGDDTVIRPSSAHYCGTLPVSRFLAVCGARSLNCVLQMVKREQFRSAALRAVKNIVSHGDTDIFPYPFESFAFFDKVDQVVDLIVEYDNNFDSYITRFPPRNINSLAPVAYSGFRWATQIDPIWNAHFLASVIALSKKIELARPSPESNIVFSYRYRSNNKSNDLFDRNYGRVQFMECSAELSNDYEFVTICDISEFYPRLNHHRLENSLQHIAGDTKFPSQIIKFLSIHTNTMSFGLPVGGPAARILSELTINQIDRLLIGARIKFTRFADDYHIFSKTKQDAYKSLIFLSEKLLENQGLSLQKSKTRIMSSAEFRATSPLAQQVEAGSAAELGSVPAAASQFTRFSLKFDPYSPNAQNGKKQMSSAYRDTVARMAAFSEGRGLHRRLTNAEDYELFEIYDRVQSFFKYRLEGVTVRPTFKGCGFIDESEGDIIHNNTLFEVKTVDRNFRSSDIRQLVTYSALEFIAGNSRFNKIGLINPRRGVYCLYDLAFVCSEISGLPGTGLLDLIGNTVSSGQSSR